MRVTIEFQARGSFPRFELPFRKSPLGFRRGFSNPRGEGAEEEGEEETGRLGSRFPRKNEFDGKKESATRR
jgi:hypothetical protein